MISYGLAQANIEEDKGMIEYVCIYRLCLDLEKDTRLTYCMCWQIHVFWYDAMQ